jgi:hypothetical protein
MESVKKYMCMDTVITAALVYAIIRWVPGPSQVAAALPIPGFGGSTTVGEAVVAIALASVVAKPISAKLCKM